MRRGPRAAPHQSEQPADGPTLSPAEFAIALTELHRRPSLQSLCDATAHLGSAALGPTWAALLSRAVSDEPLRATAASGPDQARWPLEPPQIDADAVPGLFARIEAHVTTGSTVAAVCGDALSADAAAALQNALRPRIAALAPVVVDGRRSGVVFVAVDADVPHEAVTALVEHAAAATSSLLQIDLLREHGDSDHESGVLTRAALDRTVAREMIRARRYDRPLTLVVVRPAESGAKALRLLGQTLAELIRETDLIARLDEAHLAVLLPETDQEGGQTFVVRVLGRVPGVYASAANYPVDGTTWEALAAAALATEQRLAAMPPSEAVARQIWVAAEPMPEEPAEALSFDQSPSDERENGDDTPSRPRHPAHVVRSLSDRFPQQAGPPRSLRDLFPNFSSRSAE